MAQRSTSPTARTGQDLRAVRDTLPVALSIAPFALVIGATATQLGLPPVADMAAAATVFAGAAHFAPLTMFAAGAGVLAALGTAALINARLLLYSASLEPRFRDQPRWFRWIGPALLIDQTYLMVLARDDLDEPSRFRRYWLAAGGLLLASWTTVVGLGGVLGPLLPAGSPLDAAAVVVLAGMLGPRLAAVRPALVALTALLVATAGASLPGGVGLVAGIVAGIMAAALLDRVPR
jgi:predicted branched-subunit amino acid permease